MLFCKVLERSISRVFLKVGNIGVLAGDRRVLGVYYIIHYYYCQSEGGEDCPPSPPLENTLIIYSPWISATN